MNAHRDLFADWRDLCRFGQSFSCAFAGGFQLADDQHIVDCVLYEGIYTCQCEPCTWSGSFVTNVASNAHDAIRKASRMLFDLRDYGCPVRHVGEIDPADYGLEGEGGMNQE